MKESELLDTVLEILGEKYPFEMMQSDLSTNQTSKNSVSDAVINIKFGDSKHQLDIEVKNRIDKVQVALLMTRNKTSKKSVLVTSYVSPEMAELLKQNNIEFIDICGNIFINRPPVYLFVKGNKQIKRLKRATVVRAFKASGLKVIFTLLSLPGSEQKTFRELAELSNVSLGTINWTIKDLIELGYLIDTGKQGRKLVKKKELLERWVTAYPEQLKTKLDRKKYKSEDSRWWNKVRINNYNALWGCEIAASKLVNHLTPAISTIYVKENYTKLLVQNKLRADEFGNIEILNAFWNFENNSDSTVSETVPPLLIYADLLASGDTRNIETAEKIYNEHIVKIIK